MYTKSVQQSHEKIQRISIALWLRDNTQLNPRQIAQVSNLHLFEAILIHKDLCDFTFEHVNPIHINIVSEDQIRQMEGNPNQDKYSVQQVIKRYIPKSLRLYIPGAIIWLKKNYPQLSNVVIAKYMGITKNRVADMLNSGEDAISPILVQLLDEKLLQQMLKDV
jgi:hypothetical protein